MKHSDAASPNISPPSLMNRFWQKSTLFALCISAFLSLSLLFFAPLEIYLGNIAEFSFPFQSTWVILLLAGFGCTLVLTVLLCLLPKKISVLLQVLLFGLGLCFYVQAMFLNGSMGTLTGETIAYGSSLVIINLLVWVLLLAIIYCIYGTLRRKGSESAFFTVVSFVSVTLILMQTAAVLSVGLTTPDDQFKKSDYLTSDGVYTLANEDNAIVFILDTFDASFLDSMLEVDPGFLDDFQGFTYFPNATSIHSRTYPAVPYLLTGNMCYFDIPSTEYINDAFAHSSFLPDLWANGTDIRLFTESQLIGESIKPKVSNYAALSGSDFTAVSISETIKQMLKISLYRGAPYLVKPRFEYNIGKVNSLVVKAQDRFTAVDDAGFYQGLTAETLSLGDYTSAYRFYHLWGPHPGFSINEYAQTVNKDKTSTQQVIRGDFYILSEYFRQMQALGIYENATILITADHGSSGGNTQSLDLPAAARPLLMAKPAGKGQGDPFQTSDAPVSHADLFATVSSGLGSPNAAYGKTIFEIGSQEIRDRYYYYSALYSDEDGEVALREYKISGDARDFNNWVSTGKYWDIVYSENTVSQKRFP